MLAVVDEHLCLWLLLVTGHYCNLINYNGFCWVHEVMHLGKMVALQSILQELHKNQGTKRTYENMSGLNRLYDKVRVKELKSHPSPTNCQPSPLRLVHIGSTFELALKPWSFHLKYIRFHPDFDSRGGCSPLNRSVVCCLLFVTKIQFY